MVGAAGPAPDPSRGAAIISHGTSTGVLPCMACHGPDLMGNASIGAPRIAGLPAATTRRRSARSPPDGWDIIT